MWSMARPGILAAALILSQYVVKSGEALDVPVSRKVSVSSAASAITDAVVSSTTARRMAIAPVSSP